MYISHFLDEVLAFAHRVSVLKDGELVRTGEAAAESVDTLVTSMLGRTLDLTFPAKQPPSADAPVVLSVRGLSRSGAIADVDVTVRAGEIVGLAGLIGRRQRSGAGDLRCRPPRRWRNCRRRKARRHPLPERHYPARRRAHPGEPQNQGLFLSRPVLENVSLPHLAAYSTGGVLQTRKERSAVGSLLSTFGVATKRVRTPVSTLSGGNQQKVLFARWLLRRPKVLIADEPTKGVDVGAKLGSTACFTNWLQTAWRFS